MKSFISCSEMLHAKSVHRSRCVCSFWPQYLSANLWNVWCSIKIKSRLGIHGWANEIWSSLFIRPICKSINASTTDHSGYGYVLDSFYSKEEETSIKWTIEGNDVLLTRLGMHFKACMCTRFIQDAVNRFSPFHWLHQWVFDPPFWEDRSIQTRASAILFSVGWSACISVSSVGDHVFVWGVDILLVDLAVTG